MEYSAAFAAAEYNPCDPHSGSDRVWETSTAGWDTRRVPPVLRRDLECLIANLEMDPESVMPYHRFLSEFSIPEVHAAMSTLYSLSEGNSGNMKQQLSELVKRNLEMMHLADCERIRDKNSGMYLLFLAPVLVASIKLLVDMAIFLLTFLTMNIM